MKSAPGSAKPILVPVTLVSGAIFATLVLMWLMSKSSLASHNFDFVFFDSYYIVGWSFLSIPLFLLVTFILFFSREIVTHSAIGKIITLISGVLLFLFGSFLLGTDIRIDTLQSGWSAFPPGIDPGDQRLLFSFKIQPPIMVSQIILLFALIYIAYKSGMKHQLADE